MRAILTYHSIDGSGSVISVNAAAFRAHVEWLASADVHVTTVSGLLRTPAAHNAVAITFDDAFENFATHAWPLLRDHALPATLFIPTGFVGAANAWRQPAGVPTLPLLTWDALARLVDDGLELGAHGVRHVDLRSISDHHLHEEIEGSLDRIHRETGRRPEGFAYPYGGYTDRAVALAQGAYRWACGTTLRPLGTNDDVYRLPRVDAYYVRRAGRLDAWGPRLAWYLRVRALGRRIRGWRTNG